MSQQQIFVQVRFVEDTPFGPYNDAIFYAQAEWQNTKQAKVDSDIADRVNAWIYLMKNPPPSPVLSKQQLVDLEATLEQAKIDQAALIDSQIADVQAQILSADSQPKDPGQPAADAPPVDGGLKP